MAYEPLHHKYRPQTFQDLVGQETISLTLSNALKQSKIAPAYLFSGPRGTGKTSSARILAKSLNCLSHNQPTPHPCGKCEACLAIARGSALDVMEIDAASNTGVDNIREIIERSRFAPVQCRYKIYAIDECHMLSTAAFNALLKTLEEPPPQVVFILATTDPQRVLSTIISRCQRFDYRRIPLPAMTEHLRYIADAEEIATTDEALNLIAQIANGGLRDAESLLDQLSLIPEMITVPKVWDLVGAVPEQDLLQLLQAINSKNSLTVLQQCRNLLDRGREPLIVLQNLASFYLNLLIAKTAPQNSELISVTATCWEQLCQEAQRWDLSSILQGQQYLKTAETQLKQTTQPRLWLEVTLLGLFAPQVEAAPSTLYVSAPSISPNPSPTLASIPKSLDTSSSPSKSSLTTRLESAQVVSTTIPVSSEALAASPKPAQVLANNPVNLVESVVNHEPHKVSTVVAKVAPPADNIPEIWSQVIGKIQPPTTQALLKQHCHLVDFDGQSATVGISSARLQKLYQNKVANIEAAFAQVCQHKVKVLLEVASGHNSSKSSSKVTSATAKVTSSSITQPEAESAISTLVKPNISDDSRQESANQQAPLVTKTESPPVAETFFSVQPNTVITPAAKDPSAMVALPLNKMSSGNDILQQAITDLTQRFEGELVELPSLDADDLDAKNTIEIDQPESADTATVKTDNLERENTISLMRPNDNEYDDDW